MKSDVSANGFSGISGARGEPVSSGVSTNSVSSSGASSSASGAFGGLSGGSDASIGSSGTNSRDVGNLTAAELVLRDAAGKWVDVNGKTEIVIEGGHLTLSFGNWKEEYEVLARVEGSGWVLDNAKQPGGFDILSTLSVQGDALVAYEMILDGESHKYHFVREDEKEALLAIQDLSKDLPKEISSRDLESFSLVFRYDYDGKYGLSGMQTGVYSWELEKKADGGYEMDFRGSGPSYMIATFHGDVTEEAVAELAELLAGEDIAGKNGYHKKNAVDKQGYSLVADFASGEKIRIQAEGDAGDTCVFDIGALLEVAKKWLDDTTLENLS